MNEVQDAEFSSRIKTAAKSWGVTTLDELSAVHATGRTRQWRGIGKNAIAELDRFFREPESLADRGARLLAQKRADNLSNVKLGKLDGISARRVSQLIRIASNAEADAMVDAMATVNRVHAKEDARQLAGAKGERLQRKAKRFPKLDIEQQARQICAGLDYRRVHRSYWQRSRELLGVKDAFVLDCVMLALSTVPAQPKPAERRRQVPLHEQLEDMGKQAAIAGLRSGLARDVTSARRFYLLAEQVVEADRRRGIVS